VLVTVTAPIAQPVLYADRLSICSGDSVVLMAGITGSVQWSKDGIPVDTTSTNSFTVKEGGIYTIRSLSSGGCAGSASNPVPVRVLSRPDKPLLEVLQPTCISGGQIKITSPLGSGYLYTIDRTAYNNAIGLFTGLIPGNYGVGVKSLNGCVSAVTEVIIEPVSIIDTLLSITANRSTDLCVGESVILTAGNAENYQWFHNGFAIAGANNRSYEVKGEGIYAVARRNNGTCLFPLSAGVLVRIVLPPAAPVIATDKQLICAGETVQLQASQSFALQWFRNGQPLPGSTGVQLAVQSSGTYAATSINSAGCSSSFSNLLVITVVDKPVTPVLEIDGTTQFCKDETRLLRMLKIPPTHSIQWYRNNTLIPLVFTDTLRVNDGATYRVTLTNSNGCISDFSNAIVTAVVCETGIYVPDVFTPNGDGVNDVIRPITPGIKKFKWFRIYNRWGNLVFESADAQKAWDGKLRGQDQPAETYIWVVEGADSRGVQIKKSGMLNLVR
jgi:gliding motility-associated-like protein